MFSTSPICKSAAAPAVNNFGGFIVTEEDYVPYKTAVSPQSQFLDNPGSDYGNASWEYQTDTGVSDSLAPPHFAATSLTALPSGNSNTSHFRRDESPESRRFSVGGGFTVSTADPTGFDGTQPAQNAWSDAPSFPRPAYSSQGPMAPRLDGGRRERSVHDSPGAYSTPMMHNTFPRHGAYGGPVNEARLNGGGGGGDHGRNSSPFTYHGPGGDYQRNKRLHQDFKALSKEERQTLVEKEAAASDLLERTVHLRFLPTCMRQNELAEICTECGEYLRVRICGNSTSNQNWIYGFVEFANKEAADRMLAKSGMELFNGPGRPPLRLKCNAAKQPIVDRVFHDADPESNSPCIFGLGNFASRSLKDALDSYFNLKAKEQQMQQLQQQEQDPQASQQPQPTMQKPMSSPFFGSNSSVGGTSPQLNSMGTSITSAKLSPQAKAFIPGQGFITTNLNGTSNNNSTLADDLPAYTMAGRITPMSMPSATHASAEEPSGATSSADESSESPAGVTPLHAQRQASSVMPDFLLPKSTSPGSSGMHGVHTPLNFTPTSRDGPGLLIPPPSYDDGSLSSTPSIGFTTNATAARGGDSQSALEAIMMTGLPARVVPVFGTTAPNARMAPTMMPQSDAELVVRRAAQIAVSGLRCAEVFLRTNEGFFDAVGKLRTLLDVLQRNTAITGGPANTTSRDFTAEWPQKTTQLRLFANVVLALLYLGRRAFSEALPFIQAAVTVCKEIGHEPLTKPASLILKDSIQTLTVAAGTTTPTVAAAAAQSPPSSVSSQKSTPSSNRVVGPEQNQPRSAGGDQTMAAFFANQNMEDMLYASTDASPEARSDKNGAAQQTTMPAAMTSTYDNKLDGTPSADALSSAAEALYTRDVAFHAYVWNALIALGMALEEVRPDIAHSVFGLASSQARDVLHMSSPVLDKCLHALSEHISADAGTQPRLCALLFPETMSRSCDITTFPRLFFQKSRELPLEAFLEAESNEFWNALPPNHCVQCFPA